MGTKMFKVGSFEEEIATGMSKTLFSNQLEQKYSFDRLAKAADYIGAAAELLDDNGLSSQAQALTVILKSLAGQKILQVKAQLVEEIPGEEVILEPDEVEETVIPAKPNVFKQVQPGAQPLNVDYSGGGQNGRIYQDPNAAPQEGALEVGDPSFFDDKYNPLPIRVDDPVPGNASFFDDKFNPEKKHHKKATSSDPRFWELKMIAKKIANKKKA